jgi:hypothetical protein
MTLQWSPEASKPDATAVEILFRRYWSPSGWTKGVISPAEFDYAKTAGVMFDPIEITHDAAIARALEIREKIPPQMVGNAFLASLSTRRMDWRSPLGSLSAILHLPSHSFVKNDEGFRGCPLCGAYQSSAKHEISILNFERLKWGGVRHEQPLYAALDLEWFCSLKHAEPAARDLDILRAVIDRVSKLSPADRPGNAEKAIRGLFPSNESERRTVIDILGLAGVLIPNGLPNFWNDYPFYVKRKQPSNKNDWKYPVLWLTGSDGVNHDALEFWFPDL